jgi:hypothetical protein
MTKLGMRIAPAVIGGLSVGGDQGALSRPFARTQAGQSGCGHHSVPLGGWHPYVHVQGDAGKTRKSLNGIGSRGAQDRCNPRLLWYSCGGDKR